MKRTVLTAIALAAALGVATPGFAADKKDRHERTTFTLDSAHMDSKDVIGMKVDFPDGKRAGKIDHLLFDRDGKLTHAVIAIGGVAGVGGKDVVVPWSQLRIRHDDRKDVAMVDRATLDSAPRYSRSRDRVAASPKTAPSADRDKDGVPNRLDKAPSNPARQ